MHIFIFGVYKNCKNAFGLICFMVIIFTLVIINVV